jgi:hypothetical protein
MLAGHLIGLSFFGLIAPSTQQALVPLMSGIHSVLGAFLLGVAIPRGTITDSLQAAIGLLTAAFGAAVFRLRGAQHQDWTRQYRLAVGDDVAHPRSATAA